MNPAEYSINNSLIIRIVMILTVVAGVMAYKNLPRFEDPEFTIRQALVMTSYPGASPQEVAAEVTERLEREIAQMPEVKEVISTSRAGMSRIDVEIKYEASKSEEQLQLIWGKLRHRVQDARALLPPNANPPVVLDDFGDVYGIFYLMTGEGYTPAELFDYAENLRTDLNGVEGVGKVVLSGELQEVFYVEISRERVAALGGSIQEIYRELSTQNSVLPAGSVRIRDQRVEINPTGDIESLEELRNVPVSVGMQGTVVRLADIATVERSYVEPPQHILRYNGQPAVGIGVSNASGTNVVEVGQLITRKLEETKGDRPIGIDIHEFYHQGEVVSAAIHDFILNVLTALVIVLLTLWGFMEWRSALIIGIILMLTVMATLATMYFIDIPMHRISLGALIVALGMMVDNAIVIVEGVLTGIRRGKTLLEAAKGIVRQMLLPLLGGTVVGIIAFAPIGLAPGQVAEYTNHLFWVIMISLLFSWIFAITVAPYLCSRLYTDKIKKTRPDDDDKTAQAVGTIERLYKKSLVTSLKRRGQVLAGTIGLFVLALFGFQFVEEGFFPASTTPEVVVDYLLPSGTDIRRTEEDVEKIEEALADFEGVTDIQTTIGQGTLRYKLVYQPEPTNPAFAQMLLKVDNHERTAALQKDIQAYLDDTYPQAQAKVWLYKLGPGGGSQVEAQFTGRDPEVLQQLAEQAQDIMEKEGALMVKDDWGLPVPVIQPIYSEARGRRLGISRETLADALQANFSGRQIGVFREGEDLVPIIARSPEQETRDAENMEAIQVLSAQGTNVPLYEVIDGFQTEWRYPWMMRNDQRWAIKAQSDPVPGDAASGLLSRIREDVEAIELPYGYELEWKGEEGRSHEAQAALADVVPVGFLAMVLVVVLLFNAVKQAVIIWLTVPLAMIGVVLGLLLTSTPLEFIALLGLLSLSGLLIKNAIVLVDQMDLEIRQGKPRFDAVVDAAFDRAPPVIMSALTTVLGVLPLFFDAFFKAMSVVLVFGLSFATLLTLVVVPVLYASFFKITSDERAAGEGGTA